MAAVGAAGAVALATARARAERVARSALVGRRGPGRRCRQTATAARGARLRGGAERRAAAAAAQRGPLEVLGARRVARLEVQAARIADRRAGGRAPPQRRLAGAAVATTPSVPPDAAGRRWMGFAHWALLPARLAQGRRFAGRLDRKAIARAAVLPPGPDGGVGARFALGVLRSPRCRMRTHGMELRAGVQVTLLHLLTGRLEGPGRAGHASRGGRRLRSGAAAGRGPKRTSISRVLKGFVVHRAEMGHRGISPCGRARAGMR